MTTLAAFVPDFALRASYLEPNVSPPEGRRIVRYSANCAPAYVPAALRDLTPGRQAAPVESLIQAPLVDMILLKKLEPDIENHAEMRLQLLWQQLLLVYLSNLIFSQASTYKQVGRAMTGYAAAHSSTCPGLSFQKDQGTFVLGKGLPIDDYQNATIYLPTCVNKVDSRMDGHHRKMHITSALRPRAVEVINLVAKGALDPSEGMERFIREALYVIKKAKKVDSQAQDKIFVLKCYKRVMSSYRDGWGDAYVKKLCFKDLGLRVDQQFYLNVQRDVYQALFPVSPNCELMSRLVSQKCIPSAFISHTSQKTIQRIICKASRACLPSPLQGRLKKYVSLCVSASAVQEEVALYFQKAAETKKAVLRQDMESLPFVKASAALDESRISLAMSRLWKYILQYIQTHAVPKVEQPRNMDFIVLGVLSISLN